MYLNIINNIKLENSRKKKNVPIINSEEEKDNEEKEVIAQSRYEEIKPYFTLFYGDLTKNWIYLKPYNN